MNCNYKVNIKDIQNKYKFNIFAMGGYNDSDLRKMIESVYYALPRVNGSGTSVTLTDTAFSYMKNKLNATDTSQNTTTGKNLLPTLNATQSYKQTTISVENGIFHDTTSRTGTTEYACTFTFTNNINYGNYGGYTQPTGNIIELEAGTYTFSYKKISGNAPTYDDGSKVRTLSVYQYKDTQPYTSIGSTRILGDTASFTFTLTEKTKITLCYGYYFYTDISSNVYFTLQLESGSSASEWEEYTGGIASPNPDYPQVIHTITGDNEVVVCGKNLFNKNAITTNSLLNSSTGEAEYNGNNNVFTTEYISVNKDITYSSNFVGVVRRCLYDKNKNFVSSIASSEQFTPNIDGYIRQSYNSADKDGIQIVVGNTLPQTIEPYQSNSVLLTLGDKEICKIGDYEDKIFKAIKENEVYDSLTTEEKNTLDYGKWYLRKNINKVVLNGNASEQWISRNMTNVYGYFHPQYDIKRNGANTTTTGYLCNYFSEVTPNQNWTTTIGGNNFAIASTSNDIIMTLGDTTDKVADFKTWLSTHNTIVYYVLATPTNELFNDTIQEQLEDIYNNMLSYEGQTNVSQVNEDLPFNINSTALKDLNNL